MLLWANQVDERSSLVDQLFGGMPVNALILHSLMNCGLDLLHRIDVGEDLIQFWFEEVANEQIRDVAFVLRELANELSKIKAVVKLTHQSPHAIHTPHVVLLPFSKLGS